MAERPNDRTYRAHQASLSYEDKFRSVAAMQEIGREWDLERGRPPRLVWNVPPSPGCRRPRGRKK